MTTGGRYLKRGDTFDPECHRTTYRLGLARRLLAVDGIAPEWEHSDREGLVGTGLLQRTGHVCDDRCRAVWPEYVTDEVFDRAYALADALQSARGAHAQREINAMRRSR